MFNINNEMLIDSSIHSKNPAKFSSLDLQTCLFSVEVHYVLN